MNVWLEKNPLRWLVYAVIAAMLLALLHLAVEAAVKGMGFNATKLLAEHGLGEGWGVRSVVFLLAFPLGAELLGTGDAPKELGRLLVLALAVALACSAVGGQRGGLLDPLVLLLGAATAFASALEGRQRYLAALGLGVAVMLAIDAGSIGGNLTLKTVGAWLVVALFGFAPAIALATLLATGDLRRLVRKRTSGRAS